jgi:hypothetical protein
VAAEAEYFENTAPAGGGAGVKEDKEDDKDKKKDKKEKTESKKDKKEKDDGDDKKKKKKAPLSFEAELFKDFRKEASALQSLELPVFSQSKREE